MAPQTLRFKVRFNARNGVVATPGQMHVFHRAVVEREEHHRGAILRGHVRQRPSCRPTEPRQTRSTELNELTHHAFRTQHLSDAQCQISSCHTGPHFVVQPNADDLGKADRHRLAQHGSLPLQPSHAPAQHADGVDHGRVAVSRDDIVRMQQRLAVGRLAFPDDGGQ
ncbi:hypothetical protein D3C86_1142260 [compost metagenome]